MDRHKTWDKMFKVMDKAYEYHEELYDFNKMANKVFDYSRKSLKEIMPKKGCLYTYKNKWWSYVKDADGNKKYKERDLYNEWYHDADSELSDCFIEIGEYTLSKSQFSFEAGVGHGVPGWDVPGRFIAPDGRVLGEFHRVQGGKIGELVSMPIKWKPKKQEVKEPDGGVYVINIKDTDLYKIGISNNIKARMSTLQTGVPFDLVLVQSHMIEERRNREYYLHKKFEHKKVKNEWFKLNNNDLSYINNHFKC